MKLLILFTLFVLSQANHLRQQDASLFGMEPQTAKVQRNVELPDECNICQNIVATMQNKVTEDGSLFQESKLEEFKTMARRACHGYRNSDTTDPNELIVLRAAEKECISITENAQTMMNHLYDRNPSTCEVMGHCMRCRPCPPPAECIICEPPTSHELGIMDMVHTSWESFKEWINKPLNGGEEYEDPMGI